MHWWKSRMEQPTKPTPTANSQTQANIEAGISPKGARQAAMRKFGNVLLSKDRARAIWEWPWLERLLQDLRYALRGLKNAPGYAVTVVLTLGLGLGAATTMLAIVDSVLLRPVALPHPEQLVVLLREVRGTENYDLSFSQIRALNEQSKLFSAVSGYTSMPRPVSTSDGSRIALVLRVTSNFFRMLDVHAKYGRMLTDADSGAPVAVVNYAFWRERLHSDPRAVGSTIKVTGELRTVIGVTPQGIHFPQNLDSPAVYTPEAMTPQGQDGDLNTSAWVAARLKPGVSLQQAQQETRSVLSHIHEENDRGTLLLQPYDRYLTGDVRPALLALLGGGAILLLIACGNAANLQIARATGRITEMNVRSALGASFGRLMQQIVTESVTVSLLGAALGIGLTYSVVSTIRGAYGQQFARFDELTVHPAVFFACALLAVLVGALASIAPGLNILRNAAIAGMSSTRTTTGSRIPGTLVAAQIALTCVLLVVTGLFVRTFSALESVKLGFDPHGVTSLVLMPENPHQSAETSRELDGRLLDRFAALPGVVAATMQSSVPFSHFNVEMNGATEVNGRPFEKGDNARYSLVSNNFVQVSGMRLIRGRGLLAQDDGSSAVVCLVNEAFVQKYLNGRDPVGASLRFHRDPGDKDEDMPIQGTMTVVGVLNNELQGGSLGAEFEPMVYLDYLQLPSNSVMAPIFSVVSEFAVRSALPQAALDRELRNAVKQIAPGMTEMALLPMEQAVADSLKERRLALRMVSSFGIAALLLAAIGIYGVLAYSVAQRRREIGIRMALGSSRAGATRLVTQQAATMVVIGLVVGGAASLPAGRAVRSFLFGVHSLDPFTICVTALLLLLVCAGAAAVPAWRAAQVDPQEVLRSE
jgi:putative ABC transport system permease protein